MSLHKKYQRSSCVFHKTLHFKITMCSHKNTSILVTIKPVYTTYLCVFTQKIPKILMCFSQNTSIRVTIKPVYTTYLCVFTQKIPKACVFSQNTTFQNPHEFSQQNTSIRVTIKPVYTTYLSVFTQKIPKILMCFSTKHSISKSSCVLTKKHFNSSNYKTCLYNLFVCLYTKNTKDPHVFFHKTLHFKILMCSHKNTSIRVTIKPVYTTYLCVFTQKIPKILMCFSQNTTFQNHSCVLTKTLQFK